MKATGWNRRRGVRRLGLSTRSTELFVADCSGVDPDGLGLGKFVQLARRLQENVFRRIPEHSLEWRGEIHLRNQLEWRGILRNYSPNDDSCIAFRNRET